MVTAEGAPKPSPGNSLERPPPLTSCGNHWESMRKMLLNACMKRHLYQVCFLIPSQSCPFKYGIQDVSMGAQHKNACLELMPTISIIAFRAHHAQLTLRRKGWLIYNQFWWVCDRMVLWESVSVFTSLLLPCGRWEDRSPGKIHTMNQKFLPEDNMKDYFSELSSPYIGLIYEDEDDDM